VGKTGTNPVVATRVGIDNDEHWFAFHKLRDGTIIDRREQYNVQSIPQRKGADIGWSGFLNKNHDLRMFGALRPNGPDAKNVYYVEELRDSAHGNRLVMQSITQCVAEVAPSAPAPAGGSDAVPFVLTGGAMHVTVMLGDSQIDMMVDTGANVSSVTPTVANALISTGQATELEPHRVQMADGTWVMERVISVKSLKLGSHDRTDVTMTVTTSDNGMSLLGLPVLNAIGKFTVDGGSNQLIFG
jgi:clan AA aspartic protease (TIGR02281 family)